MVNENEIAARFLEPAHAAVQDGDHAAVWAMIRAAYRAGRADAMPPDAGVGYPRAWRDGIGSMNE